MRWKNFVEDYLTFSKKERLAAFCILAIAASIYLLPKLFSKNAEAVHFQPDSSLFAEIEKKRETATNGEPQAENVSISFYEPTVNKGYTEGALFHFDPNTLTMEGWQKLGLNQRTTKTLLNYRNKGGKFYKKEDLRKIWGLPEGFYHRVEPYIQIGNAPKNFTRNYTTPAYKEYENKAARKISIVQVNAADTSALIALPGIGSKLAARIVAFRDKLGGFYTTEQIGETYGLPDSTFQMLKPYLQVDAEAVRKINLNIATKDELRMHPYIKWALANAIVEYRNQHGTFNNLEELKNIMLIDEATYKKIAPYFSL